MSSGVTGGMWGVVQPRVVCQDGQMNATGRALYVTALMCVLVWLIRGGDVFMWAAPLALIGGWFADAAGDTARTKTPTKVSQGPVTARNAS